MQVRGCSPTAPGRCLHVECRGAPARVRAWRCEGRPPLPHHFVCVETCLPYLTTLPPKTIQRETFTKHQREGRTNILAVSGGDAKVTSTFKAEVNEAKKESREAAAVIASAEAPALSITLALAVPS